jgi:hypothetical protein
MTKALKISPDLSLPYDAQTRTNVIYGGKGKGKTNCGAVLCEEFARAGLRFCVVDPLDVWWGLRYGKDKESVGLDVVILGGTRGDLPITPDAGAVVADFVADELANTIVVMRKASGEMWSNGERIRFMRDFMRRLFARQGEGRRPIHVIIDEAGRFVPQMPMRGDVAVAECIGAIEEAVELGRNVGIGVTLITQRSARMNKSVSELAECMIAFQTAGPRSIDAIIDWFGDHVPKARQLELIERLRKLPVGTALIVSPEWLDFEGEARIRQRETFDSSATPKAGVRPAKPGKPKVIDLEKYRGKMTATVEKAKAEDPRALMARIRELEKQLKQRVEKATESGDLTALRNAKAALEKAHAIAIRHVEKQIREIAAAGSRAFVTLQKAVAAASDAVESFNAALAKVKIEVATDPVWSGAPRPRSSAQAWPKTKVEVRSRSGKMIDLVTLPTAGEVSGEIGDNGVGVPAAALKVLNALKTIEDNGSETAAPKRVAALAGISPKASTWRGYLAKLRRAGALVDLADGSMQLTDRGRELATSETARFGSLDELHSYWIGKVGSARVLLSILIAAEGEAIAREDLAEQAGLSMTSSTWRGYLAKIRRFNLATDHPSGGISASDVLFPAGLS